MEEKNKKLFIIILNILGVLCLCYFIVPYVLHSMSIRNPDTMLSNYSWDSAGFILLLGFLPLLVANSLAYKNIKINKNLGILFFIPSIVCMIFNVHYLFFASSDNDDSKSEFVYAFKCVIDGEKGIYRYSVYREDNGELSVSIDDDDNIPLEKIDYTDEDTIYNSILEYYKDRNGSCT